MKEHKKKKHRNSIKTFLFLALTKANIIYLTNKLYHFTREFASVRQGF